MKIAVESPTSADGRRLIDGSETALRKVYSAEDSFVLSAEELDKPHVAFFVARDKEGAPLGCVAACDMGDYVEVKRLYVDEAAQGMGLGHALMEQLETHARAAGHRVVRLETGDRLTAACALYRKRGYVVRPAFGDYPADVPTSTYMEKAL